MTNNNTPSLHHSSTPLLAFVHALAVRFAAARRDEGRIKAESLIAHVLGMGRLELYARRELDVTSAQRQEIEALAVRVAAGEPLQYVLGSAHFHGRVFRTDCRALIPRPETEELVETVLAHTNLWCREHPLIADVGTGTGCIALTLAAERPAARVTAVDASGEALALARENADALGLADRVAWRQGDLLAGFTPASLHAVVSNPPYIARAEIDALAPEVRDHEPRLALDGGEDGLQIVARLIDEAFVALRPGGTLFLELGDGQAAAVRRRMTSCGYTRVEVRRDLAGHQRIVWGDRP